jgi:phosphatidylinositol phospholipase C delta
MGSQVTGAVGAQAYMYTLRDGARYVEIDVWDGEKEPEVYNGHTRTDHVTLDAVLASIASHGPFFK